MQAPTSSKWKYTQNPPQHCKNFILARENIWYSVNIFHIFHSETYVLSDVPITQHMHQTVL